MESDPRRDTATCSHGGVWGGVRNGAHQASDSCSPLQPNPLTGPQEAVWTPPQNCPRPMVGPQEAVWNPPQNCPRKGARRLALIPRSPSILARAACKAASSLPPTPAVHPCNLEACPRQSQALAVISHTGEHREDSGTDCAAYMGVHG